MTWPTTFWNTFSSDELRACERRKSKIEIRNSPRFSSFDFRISALTGSLLVTALVWAELGDLMSVPGRRADRLGHEIRVELAELISREVKDPRIGFTTVTRVELSADLHHARVFVSVLGGKEEQESSIEGLSSAAGFLRHEIGHRLALRRVPELAFILDHGAEAGEKIEMLLQQLRKDGGASE
jgi:ribosome-binding factor A